MARRRDTRPYTKRDRGVKEIIEALRTEVSYLRDHGDTIESTIGSSLHRILEDIEKARVKPVEYPQLLGPVSTAELGKALNENNRSVGFREVPVQSLKAGSEVTIEWTDADYVTKHLSVEEPGDVEDQSGATNEKHALMLDIGAVGAIAVEGSLQQLVDLATQIVMKVNTLRAQR